MCCRLMLIAFFLFCRYGSASKVYQVTVVRIYQKIGVTPQSQRVYIWHILHSAYCAYCTGTAQGATKYVHASVYHCRSASFGLSFRICFG